MAVTSAEELFAVLEKSKLLIPSQLAQARASVGPNDDPTSIARSLARQQLITRWQAGQLLAGRSSFYLGKYRLIELLGRGGMGSVFLGEHVTMNRRVALKIISRQVSQDPASLERFLGEARAIAALDHPNIVRAYSVDNEGERFYLVMEYVEGTDLQRMVEENGPLDCDRAVDYIRQAADGLDHAHQRNMIHCDIKPSNLLVNMQGVVKILDLGLARLTGDDGRKAAEQDDGVLGSVDYLSPEQALQSPNLDCRADIYSLGCTLYFLLTGHPPFPQGTLAQRILKHQTQDPPDPRLEQPKIPAELATLCKKMMAKTPEERCQSAAEVSGVLTDWRPAAPVLKRAAPLPKAKPLSGPDDSSPLAIALDAEFPLASTGNLGNSSLEIGLGVAPLGPGALSGETALSQNLAARQAARHRKILAIVLGSAFAVVVLLILCLVLWSNAQTDRLKQPALAPPTADKVDVSATPKPEPESPKVEPAKSEQPKPEPAPEPKPEPKVEPPQPEPKPEPEPPKPEPPTKVDPLGELVDAVDLPLLPEEGQPMPAENTVPLGKVLVDQPTQLHIALIGGDDVLKGSRAFQLLHEVGDTNWVVRYAAAAKGATPATQRDVAKITFDQGVLRIGWLPTATEVPAGYLTNCGLLVTAADSNRFVPLCRSQKIEPPILIDWNRSPMQLTLTKKDLTDSGVVRLEVTGLSGTFPKCKISSGDPIGPKESVDIIVDDEKLPKVLIRTTFDVKSSNVQIETTVMWQKPGQNKLEPFKPRDAAELKLNMESRRDQATKQLKALADSDPRRPAKETDLDRKTDNANLMTALMALYFGSSQQSNLHFRVFNQLGTYQVNLFTTPEPKIKPELQPAAPKTAR